MNFDNIKSEQYSNEGIWHTIMKQFFYKYIPKFNNVIRIEKEPHEFKDHIPDVYLELQDGLKIAIECQNSHISLKELKKRTKFYTSLDIYTLWVLFYHPCISFNNHLFSIGEYLNIEEYISNHNSFLSYSTKVIERYLYFDMYFRIYFIKTNHFLNKKTISFEVIYLLEKDGRWIEGTDFGGGYYKKYKNKFIVNNSIEKIKNMKLLCIESKNKKYKLARFYDSHPNTKRVGG